MSKKVDRKRVAALIRAARDLMNDGGKHWIKGAEKLVVNTTHIPGGRGLRYAPKRNKGESYGYCMLGGLKYAAGFTLEERKAAVIELARLINPKKIVAAEKRVAKAKSKGYDVYGDEVYVCAEYIITSANDTDKTKWSDVKDWTTRAARRLR